MRYVYKLIMIMSLIPFFIHVTPLVIKLSHSSLMPEEVVRPTPITKDEVRGLFNLWNDALATGDPQQVIIFV